MANNPYSEILSVLKNTNKSAKENVSVGRVVSVLPLIIEIGELQIDKDNILVADYLLSGYRRGYSTDRTMPETSNIGNMEYTDGINVGDKLAILQTGSNQLYIIIARLEEV